MPRPSADADPVLPWRADGDGLRLAVRAQPKASADAIDGIVRDDAGKAWLKVRVTAPADGGQANEAVMRLVAKAAGVPPRDVRLLSGATGRAKTLLLAGTAGELAARLSVAAGVSAA